MLHHDHALRNYGAHAMRERSVEAEHARLADAARRMTRKAVAISETTAPAVSSAAKTLRRRSAKGSAASLAVEAGIAVFRIMFEHWISEPRQRDLPQLIRPRSRNSRP